MKNSSQVGKSMPVRALTSAHSGAGRGAYTRKLGGRRRRAQTEPGIYSRNQTVEVPVGTGHTLRPEEAVN